MFKIIDKRDAPKQETLELPFFTKVDDTMFLYFKKIDGKIGCISLVEKGGQEITNYNTLDSAKNSMLLAEKIVEVEIHIIK